VTETAARDALSSAIRYWEPRYIAYNGALLTVVLAAYFANLPASRASLNAPCRCFLCSRFSLTLRIARRMWSERLPPLPTATGELIALSPDSPLWPWQPQTRYYLLDLGAFPKDELARRSSLAALLFRLEQRHSPEQLKELLGEVIGWFRQHEDFERLRGLFAELVREALAGLGVKVPVSEDLLEMKTNLSTLGETWKQQWLAEGRVEGLARGKAEALLCLLVERFGAVAPPWRKRIRGAKLATLDRWFKRAIVARDLSSVFEPPR
jgi:hypothetical protein